MLLFSFTAQAWEPLPVGDDPLVRMPGTQPGQVSLEGPNRCTNCHEGYNSAVEPGFNWKGSMMAQAARDPLFWATFVVAAQDSIAVLGNPNAADLCMRCHFPKGWLEGRSTTLNASAMTGADYDGVQCDFCHRMYDPHFDETHSGTREGGDWTGYWDEAGPLSAPAAADTYNADLAQAGTIRRFDGQPFFAGAKPFSGAYTEAGSGQYFVSSGDDKRASFADAEARHRMLYSRFHKSKYMCATCHDVSNAVLANMAQDGRTRGDGKGPLTTESEPSFAYSHVERTFSEFMLSDYGQQGGAPGIGPFAPDVFVTSQPDNKIAACQDCHMRDGIGAGADKRNSVIRPDGSEEHPNSGQPIHDLTGGNVWVPTILASTVSGSSNYDEINASLLRQGPTVLTMDLGQGLGLDAAALLAGADRARQQLELAAEIRDLHYDATSGALSFKVQNQTGHKLISGFPEGRRMFLNIRAYGNDGTLVYEVNPYDTAAATLKGLSYSYLGEGLPAPAGLGSAEIYMDRLVYEMKPSSDLTGEETTFHFVLGTDRYKDNRIPPKGFRIGDAAERHSVPVWQGTENAGFFTPDEYAGGYAEVALTLQGDPARVEVSLYYQTTSREYIEFLRDEIRGSGNLTLGEEAYIAQTDPFFAQLRAWGDTIWDLWVHNREAAGAAPVLMAQASIGETGGGGCVAPAPSLTSAEAGHQQVALAWSDVHSSDAGVAGYRVYFDQGGKAQLLATTGRVTGYLDTGLTNGQQYCYKVASFKAECESAFSNVLCATPASNAQLTVKAVDLETGRLVTTGKGGNRVTTFEPGSSFAQGEDVAIRARLLDSADQPLAGASFTAAISGPSTASVSSASADEQGFAIATWGTAAPRRNRDDTPIGNYTVTVAGVSAGGYNWDGVTVNVSFALRK
ncbi:MAG: multiheme c-type cytochrome [Gammaproteobacteria bacterium]